MSNRNHLGKVINTDCDYFGKLCFKNVPFSKAPPWEKGAKENNHCLSSILKFNENFFFLLSYIIKMIILELLKFLASNYFYGLCISECPEDNLSLKNA